MIELTLPRTTHQTLLSRRGMLRASIGGAGALAPSALLLRSSATANDTLPSNKAVIQIWLGGGPSHIDLYDMKPAAPAECRGPFRPIATAQPGIEVCELLPLHAPIMQHLAVLRSLCHDSHDHVAGTHWMQTGSFGPTAIRPEPTHPSIGSIVAKARSSQPHFAVPYVHLRPDLAIDVYHRQFDAGQLGRAFDPLTITMPFPGYNPHVHFDLPTLRGVPGLDDRRLDERQVLRRQFDAQRRAAGADADAALGDFYRQAFDLVTSERVRNAFDLTREPAATRERYGNTGWGQAALLCRRLVEAGVTFVALNTDNSSNLWDNHAEIEKYFKIMLPAYDRMLSGLITDLVERGLYEQVIVLVWGEFGRTPGINTRGGRDHWGNAGCALLGGGGLRGGQVFGSTTGRGEEPRDQPRRPADVLATIYHLLGIDPAQQLAPRSGMPTQNAGRPIRELLV